MENRVVAAVSEIEIAVAAGVKLVENDLWSCSGAQVGELLGRLHRLRAQVDAMELGVVREVGTRGIPGEVGALDTRTYLMGALTMAPAEASSTVQLAQALGSKLTATADALADGRICRDRAQAIADVVRRLPEVATVEQQLKVEALLLENSRQLNARDMRRLQKAFDHFIDPDGVEPREELAKSRRAAHIHANGDGTMTLRWVDTEENIAALQAALEPLSGPRPGPDGEPDLRHSTVRRADALVELVARALRHGDLPTSRGARPHLVITLTEHGPATTATGEYLSMAAVRRLSCDSDVTAIRLDTNGVPLSMGRTRRTVTPSQWIALVVRDKGCVFPNCQYPAAHTQAHHIKHWTEYGDTDLENLALLCDRHHDAVHHQGWEIRLGDQGIPELIPPPWYDPRRRPRRNTYWSRDPVP